MKLYTDSTETDQPHQYDVISNDHTKYKWYHGNTTEDEAYMILRCKEGKTNCNCFLVRCSGDQTVLSCKLNGFIYHEIIEKINLRYRLQNKEETFESIPDLVTHYQNFPVHDTNRQLLGTACDWRLSDEILRYMNGIENQKKSPFNKKFSFTRINWKTCEHMPSSRTVPQVVKIGKYVYTNGGMGKDDVHTIYRYSLTDNNWQPLLKCPTYQNSLASLDDELIVIGGQLENLITNNVYTLHEDHWIEILPPMPTPRCLSSSATYQNRIIITAGGIITSNRDSGTFTRTDATELYIKNMQWFSSNRLPFPSASFSLRIINDSCFILGGSTGTLNQCCTVAYTSISSLLENSEPVDSTYSVPQCPHIWTVLKTEYPLMFSSLAEIRGKLAAVGGTHKKGVRHSTHYISTYDFATNTWVECEGAELPTPLYRTTVINIGNDQIMCIGGQDKSQNFSAEVFIGTYKSV